MMSQTVRLIVQNSIMNIIRLSIGFFLVLLLVFAGANSFGQLNEADFTAKYLQAVDAQRKNDYATAEKIYLELLVTDANNKSVRVNLGLVYEAVNADDKALAQFRKALEIDPEDVIPWLEIARIYIDNNKIIEAENALNKIALKTESNSEYHFLRGALASQRSQWDLAIAEYIKALEFDPDDFSARYNLCRVLINNNLATQALDNAKILSEKYPNDPLSWRMLANAAEQAQNWQLAIDSLLKVLAVNSTDPEIYSHLVGVYVKNGDKQNAIKVSEQSVEKFPYNAKLRIGLSVLLVEDKQWQQAEFHLRMLLSRNPNEAIIYDLLGKTMFALKNYEEAEKSYLKVIELVPNSLDSYKELEKIYKIINLPLASRKNYTKWLEAYPDDPYPLLGLALTDQSQGNYIEAESNYKKYLSKRPNDPEGLKNYSQLLVMKKQNKTAIELLEKAKAQEPNSLEIRLLLAGVYRADSNQAKAVEELNSAKKINPKASAPYLQLANMYSAQKQYQLALNEYKEYLSVNPADTATIIMASRTYVKLNDKNSAIELLKNNINNADNPIDILTELILIAKTPSEKQKVAGILSTTVTAGAGGDPKKYVDLLVFYSRYLQSQNKLPEAIDALTDAKKLDANNISIDINLSKLYFSQSLFDEALNIAVSTLKTDPDNNDLWRIVWSISEKPEYKGKYKALLIQFAQTSSPYELPITLLVDDAVVNQYASEVEAVVVKRNADRPNHIQLLTSTGKLLAALGKNTDAIAVYKSAFEISPKDVEILHALCQLYEKTEGYTNEMFTYYDKLSRMTIDRDPEPSLHLADLYVKAGRKNEGYALAKSVLNRYPQNTRAQEIMSATGIK